MKKRTATFNADFTVRSEGENEDQFIEGYFIRFNEPTELWTNFYEQIDPNSVDDSMTNDVRCLFNHNTDVVLGRTSNNTVMLEKRQDGLWGRVKINTEDSVARDVLSRIKRGDISSCSFGFIPTEQDYEERDDSITCTIRNMNLLEVSVVTFPAYETTSIGVRQKEYNNFWTERMKERLRSVKETNAAKRDRD